MLAPRKAVVPACRPLPPHSKEEHDPVGVFSSSQNTNPAPAPAAPPPPIYLLTHEFYPKHGGIATFAEEIARAATAIGLKIEVWAQSATKEKPWPFAVRRLPIKGTLGLACRLKSMLALFKRRREWRNATVYVPEPGPMLALMLLQFNKSTRPRELILTFHGSEILRMHANPAHRMLIRRLIKRATRISTLTEFTRNLLHDCFPGAAGKTIITPGAIRGDLPAAAAPRAADPATASPFARHPAALPAAAPGKKIVLTVGRVHPRKGQLHVLRALQLLPPPLRKNVEYWIAGKTTSPAYKRALAREAATASNLGLATRFLGDVPDRKLGEVYSRADIFAMTSVNHRRSIEGFGLVYLEASAYGLPVVAHDTGGVREAVLDGVTGLLVAPAASGDAAAARASAARLAAALEKLLADEPLCRRMGEAGRRHALRNTWTDSAKKLFAGCD